MLLDLANHFIKKSYDVEIICAFIEKDLKFEINNNIRISSFPNFKNKYLSMIFFFFFSFVKIKNKNLIISCHFTGFYLCWFKSLFVKLKHFYFVQGIENVQDGLFSKIINFICINSYNFNNIITTNISIYNSLRSKNFKPRYNINIGISENFFTVKQNYFFKEYDIIYFFRSEKFKGAERFLKFIKENPKLKYCIITQDKGIINNLKKNFSYLKIFSPRNDLELIKLIDKSKLLIYTSHYDGLGLPILECMSRKVPFLSYKYDGLFYINSEIEYQIVKNTSDLKNKVNELLSNQELYTKLSKKCYNLSLEFKNENAFNDLLTKINY